MCGRYYINPDDEEMNAVLGKLKVQYARGEVFPGDSAAVFTKNGLQAMRWGLARYDGKGEIINARAETAAIKPTFARLYNGGRCLVPASCYFEWEKRGNEKIKYAINVPDAHITWLAGLASFDGDTPRFVLLTRQAGQGIEFIHSRMPVILPPAALRQWLFGACNLSGALTELAFRPA